MSLLEHEELAVRRGPRTGIYLVVAIHSTALGPALGGARCWCYGGLGDAIVDALRLSEAMTYKAAAAGLDLGGGKAVFCVPPDRELSASDRRDLMLDLGDVVESLDGRYVTAEDVGTGAEDMAVIEERTAHVVGLPPEQGGSGDPSPVTARGVERAIRASCEHCYGTPLLEGRVVAVVGLGHVGMALARRLRAAGAELVASDIDQSKRRAAEQLGARWANPVEAITVECDVLAPCALGGAINEHTVDQLRCEVVCGAANNVLADDSMAKRLHERGILYAPDFIANAGGLINVYGELHHLERAELDGLVDGIGEALTRIFELAAENSITPLDAARELALRRLQTAPAAAPSAALARM